MFEGLFQPLHLLVIFLVALIVFDPKRLPELGRRLERQCVGLRKNLKERNPKPKKLSRLTEDGTKSHPVTPPPLTEQSTPGSGEYLAMAK